MLTWSTEPFETTAEMIGTGAAHLFVETDTDDTNLILRLWDEAPRPDTALMARRRSQS